MKRYVLLAALALGLAAPQDSQAQLEPGKHYIVPVLGPTFAMNELLRTSAVQESRPPSTSDPYNPIMTDIKNDPGLMVGVRYVYALTRRLALEATFDTGISVCAIRQLEIKPDAEPGDQPQYETTTTDTYLLQWGVQLAYYMTSWQRILPYFTVGAAEHIMNLRQKGEIDPDPVRDRAIVAGLGTMIRATDRLSIRAELRDTMYNFLFDNQFVDPVQSQQIIFNRPDFYNATVVGGTKFQNDLALTLGFMVRMF